MGIIKAALDAVGGTLADSWLEVIEADNMSDTTVFTGGVSVRRDGKRGSNTRATADTISNGSKIHVYPNQFMLLVEGGKVVDFTAEEGYYTVNNSTQPSLFTGDLGGSIKEAFERIKFGGVPSTSQKVFFINMQEIKGIKFGTRNPVNYFDNFYNSELFLRAHGTYSLKIVNPLLFYAEAIPKNARRVDINDINEQYRNEFLEALQTSLNQMSVDGVRVSHVASKGRELSKYMAETLDEDWSRTRGMEVQSVGIASISYDEESQKLINMRNKGAMLSDASIREGFVQGSVATGIENAGSNSAGAAAGFMGVGLGMSAAGGMGAASNTNLEQMRMQQQAAAQAAQPQAPAGWTCECGAVNTGKFCSECGKPMPAPKAEWVCSCGTKNTGKFCSECGKPMPATNCPKCGAALNGSAKFCPECGEKLA
ncbi:MAG: SPFH domain-containing protein [Clostridia bacterium]|nr:SPFH domain-containing protein [Clostridia bacterium]MBQ4249056.1 SPFH domain-containing protein [Clostridia bacterium]